MRRLSMAEMKAFQNDQLGFLQQTAKEHGGVAQFKMLWMEFVILTEPEVIREFLMRHAGHVHRDPFVSPIFRRIFGNGVFVAEGAEWKRKRKLMQPAFHAARIRDYATTMAAYTQDMLDTWSPGDVRPLDQDLTQLTLRIIAKTMYGVDLSSRIDTIGRLMKGLLTIVERQLRSPFHPPAWVPTPSNLQHRRLYRELSAVLLEIIRERKAAEEDSGDLLSMLLHAKDEDGDAMSEQELLNECMTLFVAGHETTAAALTWAWYVLGRNPDIAAKVTEEVDRVVGRDEVTFESVKSLPYVTAFIKETMRLYPPAYGFARTVIEPFQIGEHAFNKKAVVLISSFALHRRPDLYEEPTAFRPERFLDQAPDDFAYLPFGAGPRVCMGNMFAMMEAVIVLATMVQRVTLEPVSDIPAELSTLVTLRPKDTIEMTVGKR